MNKRLLITTKDIKELREFLFEQQDGVDMLMGLKLEDKQAVLDHCHDSQHVRGVIGRQPNAALGKIENLYKRFIAPNYDVSLEYFLIQCVKYINANPDYAAYHPKWIKKCMTEFRKLKEGQKCAILREFNIQGNPKKSKERVELFEKFLKKRLVTFGEVIEEIDFYKEQM